MPQNVSSLSVLRRAARARLASYRLDAGPSLEESEREARLKEARGSFDAFCSLIRILDKSGRRVPLHRNAIQSLFEIERTGRDIVLKPRQIGLTTLELARDLWTFLCKDGARVVVVCQAVADNSPAKLLSSVVQTMITALRSAGWDLRFDVEAWNEWVLPSGASLRIISAGASEDAADKKGRAGTITRLHCTEIAFYEHARKTMNALLECVPGPETGSEIVLESTANGAAGYFFDACQSARAGKSESKFHFFPWFAHPEYRATIRGEFKPETEREEKLLARGVTPEQLQWARLKVESKGLDDFLQEYPEDPDSCFVLSGRGFFDRAALKQLSDGVRSPIETRDRDRIRIYARPVEGLDYVLSADPSEGIEGDDSGNDPAAGIVAERYSGEIVAVIDGYYRPHELAEKLRDLAVEYNTATIAPERNNHGHAVLQALDRELGYHRVFQTEDEKPGWLTNSVTRPQMLDDFNAAIRKGLWTCPDAALLSQLRTFVVLNGKPQGAIGEHDDLVIAAAINWAVRQLPSPTNMLDALSALTSRGGKLFND